MYNPLIDTETQTTGNHENGILAPVQHLQEGATCPHPPPLPNENGETVTVPTPVAPGTLPSIGTGGLYVYNLGKKATKKQLAIMAKGIPPEKLPTQDLREVYFHVTASPGRKIYSASTVSYIEKYGKHPDEGEPDESESLFVGGEVHKAMETKGESLKLLKAYADLGEPPKKPETKLSSKDHEKLVYEIYVNKLLPAEAYMAVKSTQATQAITLERLQEYLNDKSPWVPEDKKSEEGKTLLAEAKAIEKVIKAGETEYTKFKPLLNIWGKYFKDLDKWEANKQQLRDEGGTIIDELEYIANTDIAGGKVRERIISAYTSLTSHKEVMDLYYLEDKAKGMESYYEFPILWALKSGRKRLPCKSMLDKVHFDFNNKKVYVLDIKTHARNATGFFQKGYISFKYYRSMSFYFGAVKYYLENARDVTDIQNWEIQVHLLPVSTSSFEVGCYRPLLEVSHEDIKMGKEGGFRKPPGFTLFDKNGHVQYALDERTFEILKGLGFIHEKALDFKVKGWMEIIEKFENSFALPCTIKQ